MNKDTAKQLRQPFPESAIGKLPKGGVELDYVGHAAVTDRLLQVDPEWTWEPVGVTDHGLPLFDAENGLWIKLTVAGVTRYGYGDGKNPKECISDAIRNAAMRFGVALDLWSKEDLESSPAVDTRGEEPSAGDTTLGGGGSYGEGETPTPDDVNEELRALMAQYLDLCDDQGLKPLATLGKALKRAVKTDDLVHATLPEVETAIAFVAQQALKADA